MFFWIVGNNKDLIEHWLRYIHATSIKHIADNIILFESDQVERFKSCATLIKYWSVYQASELSKHLTSSLVGVADKTLGVSLKKQYSHITRFKLTDSIHTDKEIQQKWQEIIALESWYFWIVEWYQVIELYESIDFWKPVSGMEIWMMPSKLALNLLNIALGHHEDSFGKQSTTIRDPFTGFGTSNFLANALGYDSIWSDLNIIQAKQNLSWRKQQPYCQVSRKITLVQQDVMQQFTKPLFGYADIILSEGYLGRTITKRTKLHEVQQSSQEVHHIYRWFFKNLHDLSEKNNKPVTLVMTIPVRLQHNISLSQDLARILEAYWRTTTLLNSIYARPWQLVGRQVLLAQTKQ